MFRMRLAPAAVLAALAAAPLAAGQQPAMPMGQGGMMAGHDMMQMMAEMMPGAARIMAFGPAHLLMHQDALGLTDQQVAKLTALKTAADSASAAAMKDAKMHGDELGDVLKAANPDTAALRAHFTAMHDAMGRAHLIQMKAAVQAQAVLTELQRARVEGWADMMGMHGGGAMGGAMPGGMGGMGGMMPHPAH